MTSKIVYQCDRAGMLVGQTDADPSPLEQDVYLIPAGCTEIPPPDTWPGNKWPRFNGSNWDLVTKPSDTSILSPEQKLAEFLQNNPDVLTLINKDTIL